jgi:hypothetical protein
LNLWQAWGIAFGFLVLALFLVGFPGCSSNPDPCSAKDAEMVAKAAECRLRVDQDCKGIPDSECDVIRECDAWADARCGR